MKKIAGNLAPFCLAAASVLASPAAIAELTANAALTSNYVWRGLSQTDDGPALQAGIDYAHDAGFYLGAWGSNVDNGADGEGLEYDLYAGFANKVGEFGYDLGYLTYSYTDEDYWPDTVTEGKLGLSYGPGKVNYYIGDDGTNDYTYAEIGLDLELPQETTLALHYGLVDYDVAGAETLYDYAVGVSKDFGGFNVGLSVADHEDDDTLVFLTVKKEFGL